MGLERVVHEPEKRTRAELHVAARFDERDVAVLVDLSLTLALQQRGADRPLLLGQPVHRSLQIEPKAQGIDAIDRGQGALADCVQRNRIEVDSPPAALPVPSDLADLTIDDVDRERSPAGGSVAAEPGSDQLGHDLLLEVRHLVLAETKTPCAPCDEFDLPGLYQVPILVA
ncbi:MAG: hypothetical protein ACYTKD_19695 [Planctomycetota bacterium]